ncbi:TIM-barrel domain-containing protein [Sessilibacter corallicola]
MKKRVFSGPNPIWHQVLILFILSYLFSSGAHSAEKAVLIRENVAMFYPDNFDAKGNLPSFALVKEPKKIGPLPKSWKTRVEFSSTFGQPTARVQVKPSTNLYGTGEVYGTLTRKGYTRSLWNTDNYTYKKDNGQRLYQSHPWVLGVREDGTAFGVFADNTWKQTLALDTAITFTSEGPAFRVLVIEGKTPQEVMTSLAELTGHMALPPLWSLGFQQSRYSYYPESRAKELADTYREKKLPIDVIWFDIHYMDKYKVFTFDSELFPDPKRMNDYLHDHKMKGVWMIDPGVGWTEGYSVFDSGTEEDVWVKDAKGKTYEGEVWPGKVAFPDYTQPKTASWWADLYTDFMAMGIDGVWNDMNEPADFSRPDWTMPEDNVHAGGIKFEENGKALPADSHKRYHNVYGMLMVKASLDGIKNANPEKRPFILTRSNFLGGHRYAATWTGDNDSTWEHLRASIPMSLNLGLSGQPFNGPDIGGFEGNATPELFGHWMALGAFYPFARAHTTVKSDDQEPWEFGKSIEDVSRTALERRYRLMPYLYTQFQAASVNGMPVMQPTFFADPTDGNLRSEEQTFLFGPDLLIVPQWADKPTLPKGNWRTISLVGETADDEYQPQVKIRDGAIVPAGEVIQSTEDYSLEKLTLFVSLDEKGKASGKLYHDAGDGYGYQNGEFVFANFTAKKKGKTVTVKIADTEGNYPLGIKTVEVKLMTEDGVKTATGSAKKAIRIKL